MSVTADTRQPNPVFGIAWVVWSLATLVGPVWPNVWFLGVWLVYFFGFEIGGLVWAYLTGNPRNQLHQLSQMAFWSYRKVSKVSERPVTLWSWGGAYTGFILFITYNAGHLAFRLGAPLWFSILGPAFLIPFLVGHWLMSWRYG